MVRERFSDRNAPESCAFRGELLGWIRSLMVATCGCDLDPRKIREFMKAALV